MVSENRRFAVVFHLAAIVAAFAGFVAQLPAQVVAGGYFPPLNSTGLSGGKVPVTKGHVVLVDFWASWCAPCKASFPTYSLLQSEYADRGLIIVAVGVDENVSEYTAFVDRLKPTFATLHDSKRALVSFIQVPTMPTSYLLDRDGKVRFVHPGFRGLQTERELRSEIEILLNEKAINQ
jgi:thiol-disulfide isomerase/thioredoxin